MLTSGYTLEHLGERAGSLEEVRFLKKPFSFQKLSQAVRECLDGASAPKEERVAG